MRIFHLVLCTMILGALAFSPLQQPLRSTCTTSRHPFLTTKLRNQRLSDVDEMCIENVAELCTRADVAIDGCDLEEYEALSNQLNDQRAFLQEHVDRIDLLLRKLSSEDIGIEQS